VGFNPFRRHRRSVIDLVLVAGTLFVAAILVIWAITG